MARDARRPPPRRVLLLLIVATCIGDSAQAHLLNMSRAQIQLQTGGRIEVRLELDLLVTAGSREAYFALSELATPLDETDVQRLLQPLPSAIELLLGGVRLPLRLERARFPQLPRETFLDPLRWPRTELILRGDIGALEARPGDGGLRVTYTDAFRFEEPIANTFVDTQSQRSQTRWLVTGQTSPVFDASAWSDSRAADLRRDGLDWPGLLDFLRAGTVHILPGGMDHLLFVAGLVLGAASLPGLLVIISLFTAAHSITLCAMALGWVSAPPRFVELMILLSILWVALANLRIRIKQRSRWLIVLFFGLLHGLGFASALMDMGLPSTQLLPSLIAFNVGVELGQLVFVGALLACFALANKLRRADARRPEATLLPLAAPPRQLGSLLIAVLTAVLLLRRLTL